MRSWLCAALLASASLAVPASADDPSILLSIKRMEYDSFFRDCRLRLGVANRSSLAVHEYRISYEVELTDGYRPEYCEDRSGHPALAFESRCSPNAELLCEAIGRLVVREALCLDSAGAELPCGPLLGSEDERVTVELAP